MMQEMERMNKNAQKKMNTSIAKPVDSKPAQFNPLAGAPARTQTMNDGLAVGLRKNSEYTAVLNLGNNPLMSTNMDGISPDYIGTGTQVKRKAPNDAHVSRVKELEQSDLFKAP